MVQRETRKNPIGYVCIVPLAPQNQEPTVLGESEMKSFDVEVFQLQPQTPRERVLFQRVEPTGPLSVETHFYDGKLKDRIAQHPSLKLKRSNGVVKSMRKAFSRINSPYLSKILVESPQNYDNTNDIDALDILCSIYDIYVAKPSLREDIEGMLKTQFDDMSTGFCSQGRCTRLLQIFFSLCDL